MSEPHTDLDELEQKVRRRVIAGDLSWQTDTILALIERLRAAERVCELWRDEALPFDKLDQALTAWQATREEPGE